MSVALAEDPDGGGRALILQRASTFDQQDAALGMDTYCLTDESGASVYGGVLSCALANNTLTLHFDAPTADALATAPVCRFHLHADDDRVTQLRDGLRRIFADSSVALTL